MSDGPPRPARRRSLRTQLVLWNVAALALLLGGLGVIVRYTVYSTILASVDGELDRRTRPPADRLPPGVLLPGRFFGRRPLTDFHPHGPPDHHFGSGPPDRHFGGPPDHHPPFGDREEGHGPDESDMAGDVGLSRHYDLSGHPLGRPDGRTLLAGAAFARAARGETVFSTVRSAQGPLRVVTRPFPWFGRPQGVVQAAYPLSDVDRAMSGVDRALLTLIPVGLLGAGLGGALLTGRVLARVRAMAQAAGRISDADLGRRLPVSGQDEFADLAGAFNAVLDRLQAAFGRQARLMEQQRRFTADASHELKTPLTIIKGNTSLALGAGPVALDREAVQEMDAAADTMGRLVQDLLLLARFDADQAPRTRFELLIGDVLARAAARTAPKAGVTLQVVRDDALTVWGNEDELERLFANLLDNAVRHTPPDGSVRVGAEDRVEWVEVTLADTGDGIAPEHLPHLGERFYRVDSARARPDGGTGLGLSICRSIVGAHGGTMTFESQVGRGTTVRVTLPALPPPMR